jgi:hypothetical protein
LSRSSVYCHRRSVSWQFDLVSLWKESVESEDKFVIPLEKSRDASNDTWCIQLLCLESLHDIQKLVVDVRTISKLHFDLIKVEKCVFNAKFPHHDEIPQSKPNSSVL